MKTLQQVPIQPVYVEFIPEQLEPGKLYISEVYETAVHACLCGCGEQTVTPLGAGQWTLTKSATGLVSLSPSIGNYQFACRSHYIITRNVANFV